MWDSLVLLIERIVRRVAGERLSGLYCCWDIDSWTFWARVQANFCVILEVF